MKAFGKKIKLTDIFKQLKADLIGKDSYRGVTLTYSWLANQFGHFSLGFIPAIVLYKIMQLKCNHSNFTGLHAAIYVAGFWFLFELYNFLGPLLLNKNNKNVHKNYVFAPRWFNVAFDTATDIIFFGLGSFTAGRVCSNISSINIALIIISIILIYPICYWFLTKMFIQYARFPMQFRLSQWAKTISENDKKIVEQYLIKAKQNESQHLLIFGADNTGKSSLSVGIATELSIARNTCSYYTCIKWITTLNKNNDEIKKEENNEIWTWRNADAMVIDDVNSGKSITGFYLSAAHVKLLLLNGHQNNIDDVVNKNVIWVMGAAGENNANIIEWENMLAAIGIDKEKIKSINLY